MALSFLQIGRPDFPKTMERPSIFIEYLIHFKLSAECQACLMLAYILNIREKYKCRTPFNRINYVKKWLENHMYIYNLRYKMRKDSNLEMNLDWIEEEREGDWT